MATVLVSGGGGYVGRFIAEQMLRQGHKVIVTGRTAPAAGFFSRSVTFVSMSLEAADFDPTMFRGVDAFVHAAFDHVEGKYRGGEGTDPDGFVRRNLHGSVALFRSAREAGVGRAVFLSSRAVYGLKAEGEVLFETTPPEPETLYGQVKLEVERALLAMVGEGFQPVVLRITGVYGPAGEGREHKWSGLIRNLLGGMAVMGRVASEVHGDDVASAVALVLGADRRSLADAVFNVSDIVVDRADLADVVSACVGKHLPGCERSDPSGLNVMDTTRLRMLGWRPGGAEKLRATVAAMVEEALGPQ